MTDQKRLANGFKTKWHEEDGSIFTDDCRYVCDTPSDQMAKALVLSAPETVARAEELERQCAVYRDALEEIRARESGPLTGEDAVDFCHTAKEALSTDEGKDYVPRSELEKVRREFQKFVNDVEDGMECLPECDSFSHADDCPYADPIKAFSILRERLRKAEETAAGVDNAARDQFRVASLRVDRDRLRDELETYRKAIDLSYMTRLQEELHETKRELEQCRKDAERYQWLRDGGLYVLPYKDHGAGPEFGCGEYLNAEIDAAMESQK